MKDVGRQGWIDKTDRRQYDRIVIRQFSEVSAMNRGRKILVTILIVIFSAVALVAVWKIVDILMDYGKSESTYQSAAEQFITTPAPVEDGEDAEEEAFTAETVDVFVENQQKAIIEVDFEMLQGENPDVVGWLYCKGTRINYPVVQGSDNVYYMDHMYDGQWNSGGSIFMDYRNTPGFADGNTLIYGHHMKDGSMFENLVGYREQKYYNRNMFMWYVTPEQDYLLLPFAGYVTDSTSSAYQMQFGSDEEKQNWLESRVSQSDFESAIVPTAEDTIVTLSTCSYEYANARYVVQCILRPVGE